MTGEIRTDRIISAFCNPVDQDKIAEYTEIMHDQMMGHGFPPITGYPAIISEDDIDRDLIFMTGEEISEDHIGERAWFCWDGHHRTYSAIEAGLPKLEVEWERSAICIEADLERYDTGTLPVVWT